jgi:hypothetical protein
MASDLHCLAAANSRVPAPVHEHRHPAAGGPCRGGTASSPPAPWRTRVG